MAQSTTISSRCPSLSAIFSACARVMVRKGDSSSSSFQIGAVGLAALRRPRGEHDAVQDQPPHHPVHFDHAAVGEELLEIAPHRPIVGVVRRAEIDQKHADLAEDTRTAIKGLSESIRSRRFIHSGQLLRLTPLDRVSSRTRLVFGRKRGQTLRILKDLRVIESQGLPARQSATHSAASASSPALGGIAAGSRARKAALTVCPRGSRPGSE